MKNIDNVIEEIEELICYDGTEFGESVQRLIDTHTNEYAYTPEFIEAVEKELREMHRVITEEMELVEEVIPIPARVVRHLRNKSE